MFAGALILMQCSSQDLGSIWWHIGWPQQLMKYVMQRQMCLLIQNLSDVLSLQAGEALARTCSMSMMSRSCNRIIAL